MISQFDIMVIKKLKQLNFKFLIINIIFYRIILILYNPQNKKKVVITKNTSNFSLK